MNDATTIVSIIALAAALVLAARGLRSHELGWNRTAAMAAIWAAIIATAALLFDRYTQ